MTGAESDFVIAGVRIGADAMAQIAAGTAGSVLTLIVSYIGFEFSSWRTRTKDQRDQKREKLEELCQTLQRAIFHISLILGRDFYQDDDVPASSDNMADMASVRQSLSQSFIIGRLYFTDQFDANSTKVAQASRITDVMTPNGEKAFSRKRLAALSIAVHELNNEVVQEFSALLK